MTPDERAAAKACARMLRDIFVGCGCPKDYGCPSCDSYSLLPRAVRRSDVRYSTLDELLASSVRSA